ncbi:GAF domain-containing protein [Gilvibacter sp. SZ-19]|uniref:GAF domain-containing protein n=1 Tax=unclassified Gilvibacter TaxID=2625242 RepID=UPI000B3CC004|nr:GAF domain-containing protein [Gilvibacter sp. SZ-19]ARV12442.1 histidine kinase [Gilvibacter sp. SZ-19]
MNLSALKPQVQSLIETHKSNPDAAMQGICDLLQAEVAHYDWVGFYFADHDKRVLHLGKFAGEPTDHTTIPFGKGICGQVAESNANFVVPDVKAQDNYIACSITVKAEIVIPLFKDGVNIGQIDIDSNTIDPFTTADEEFLTWVNAQLAEIL